MNSKFLKSNKNLNLVYTFLKQNQTVRKYTNSVNLQNYVATNEPILDYKKDSSERASLIQTITDYLSRKNETQDALFDVPIIIGDKEIRTNNVQFQKVPFDHGIKLAKFYHADKAILSEAIENSLTARAEWENSPFEYRANILLKAADMLSTTKRSDVLAATMLGQGKTIYQAGRNIN